MSNIAIMTMVYNETINLPLWIRHYSRQCPTATLFVIDHGSDDGSTSSLGNVRVLPLPRTPFDDITRAEMVSEFQHGLIRYYDTVIYTDCDEMLVADPRLHPSLEAFLATQTDPVIAPIGLNLHHQPETEPPIDLAAPILGQRQAVRFASSMCKPAITRVPLLWSGGFHWCDQPAAYRRDLYQFHLRFMDRELSLKRLHVTRHLIVSERAAAANWGRRQRQTDQDRIREEFTDVETALHANGPQPFEFESEMQRLTRSTRPGKPYVMGEAFRGRLSRVPERFHGLI